MHARLLPVPVLLVTCVVAIAASAAERTHDIEPADYFTLADITAVAVSPDGATLAWAERRWQASREDRNTDLWVMDLATRTPRRLTFDPAGVSHPVFSPDGRTVYFAAAVERAGEQVPPYDGSRQVWQVGLDGGEPRAVTTVDDGIDLFDLTADGTSLFYTVGVERTDEPWKELRDRYRDLEYGHGVTTFSEVWRLDLVTWRAERLLAGDRVVHAFDATPDGARLALLTTPDNEVIHVEGWSVVEVLEAGASEPTLVTAEGWRADHPSPFGWIDDVAWADDGGALAFTVSFDGHPTALYVAEGPRDGLRLEELERPQSHSLVGGSARWRPASRDLCLRGDIRARCRLVAAEVRGGSAGAWRELTPGDVTVDAFAFDASGRTPVVVTATTTGAPDVYLVTGDGRLDRLTDVNPQVATWKLPGLSVVRWTAPDGTEVEGILELPPGHDPTRDGRLPMVVELHGGPTSATRYELRFWIYGRTLLAAKGFALLSPNYRGSTGYGDRFLTDLIGRENDIEVADILAGVDAMVERGIADPDRLGVMGWSNGGFLTNALIAASDRFRAASSGAGVLDQALQWAVEDTPGHVINFMGGRLPWQDPEAYRKGSPLYGLDRVRTPTLIHVGGSDPRVPPAHSRALYRALRQYLGVPVELVVYPGAAHGLSTRSHREAKIAWDLAWFERYLKAPAADTAVSPPPPGGPVPSS